MPTRPTTTFPLGMRRSSRSLPRHGNDEVGHGEIQNLRKQIMELRSTVAEQEESIAFLRDLLAQRWFDVDE